MLVKTNIILFDIMFYSYICWEIPTLTQQKTLSDGKYQH